MDANLFYVWSLFYFIFRHGLRVSTLVPSGYAHKPSASGGSRAGRRRPRPRQQGFRQHDAVAQPAQDQVTIRQRAAHRLHPKRGASLHPDTRQRGQHLDSL